MILRQVEDIAMTQPGTQPGTDSKGQKPPKYRIWVANKDSGINLAQIRGLRSLCFKTNYSDLPENSSSSQNCDHFDAICDHILVVDTENDHLVATCRLLLIQTGTDIGQSYSSQFYDLSPISGQKGPMLEIGRFCIDPNAFDPDIVRMIWAEITKIVDQKGVTFLFGCTSFMGTRFETYQDCFQYLVQRHRAPAGWMPLVKSHNTLTLDHTSPVKTDGRKAEKQMPTLLKSYLAMGGWVSDHVVVDPEMDTIHVFTGLEVSKIPENRKQRLRALVR